MRIIKSFSSVPWSFNGKSRSTALGFGTTRRFRTYYTPLHRDSAIVGATEVIDRPDIAVSVPLVGDTWASRGQEEQKNDATIERRIDLPVLPKPRTDTPTVAPTSTASTPTAAEGQDGKGVTEDIRGNGGEANVQTISVKDLSRPSPPSLVKSAKVSSNAAILTKRAVSESAYVREKRRRLEQRENDFLLR
jgi:hypothetical protein